MGFGQAFRTSFSEICIIMEISYLTNLPRLLNKKKDRSSDPLTPC